MMNMKLLPIINNRNTNLTSHLDSPRYGSLLDTFFQNDFFDDRVHDDLEWKENDDSYSLKLEVPGFKAGEISVDINNDKLTVNAQSKRNGYENSYFKEVYGSPLESVELNKATAKLEDGILLITLPKSEKSKGVKIKVE